MSNRSQLWCTMLVASLILSVADFAQAQQGGQPPGRNMSEMKFAAVPGLPTCAPGSVQAGDPSKAASLIIAKLAAGCSIPWHWHTPNEHLMIVSGVARVEEKDGKPVTLRQGGFALLSSRHVHQFRCTTACVLYVYSDVAFDIHYVDGQGKEISPDAALKAVKEKSGK